MLGVTLLHATSAFLLPGRPATTTTTTTTKRQRPTGLALASSATATPPPPTNKKPLPPAQATKQFREELLTLVTMPEEAKEGREEAIAQRIDFVLSQLSELYVPPQTLPYMNLLLQGTWVNVYNSWTVRRQMTDARAEYEEEEDEEEDEDDFLDLLGAVDEEDLAAGAALASGPVKKQPACLVELRGFQQALSPNLTTGGLVNTVQWECTAGKDGDQGLAGALVVRSRFDVNSRGMLEVGEVEHDLRMKRAPKHPDALIRAVQRVVPFDVFDPNGTFVQTAFMDHELRATQTHSTRFGTITSVYARNGTELAAWLGAGR